ncbi:FACT complex subunit SSRP1 [Galdieria sulphuraria]|nr:FACT complex subunit SSRP1 [Galdieria sulphuraria]
MTETSTSRQEALSQYGGVSLAGTGASSGTGTLRVHSGGISWRAKETARTVDIDKENLLSLRWIRGARGMQLVCVLRGDNTNRFEGFREQDFEVVNESCKEKLSLEVKRAPQPIKGWNWGDAELRGRALIFHSAEGVDAFDVPLEEVSQVQMPSSSEVALEFHVDDTAAKTDECLVELRLYVHNESHAADLYKGILKSAESSFTGESLINFVDMPLLVPRGRYEVDLYPNHLKLHGKSFDYKILYTAVTRMFLLPKPDEAHITFVVSLDPPVRQGNTLYPHLVFQFQKDEEVDAEFALTENELKSRYPNLVGVSGGATWEVFSKILRELTKKPLHSPISFKSHRGQSAVRTALGANDGYLFFLENYVEMIEFKRMDLERRFDLQITLSSGHSLLFSNIDRPEFDNIYTFLEEKRLPMSTIKEAFKRQRTPAEQQDDNLDDEDDEQEEEEEDEDFDPNKKIEESDDEGEAGSTQDKSESAESAEEEEEEEEEEEGD